MRKFLIFGLMAAATVFMSADVVLAGGGHKKNKGKSKGATKNSSIKFTYEVEEEANGEFQIVPATITTPDLAVLVRSEQAGPPKTAGDLKAAVVVEPGGEHIAKNLKPGTYNVWLGLAASLDELTGVPDDTPASEEQVNAFVIDMKKYTLVAGEELHVLISPTGMKTAPNGEITTLPPQTAN